MTWEISITWPQVVVRFPVSVSEVFLGHVPSFAVQLDKEFGRYDMDTWILLADGAKYYFHNVVIDVVGTFRRREIACSNLDAGWILWQYLGRVNVNLLLLVEWVLFLRMIFGFFGN